MRSFKVVLFTVFFHTGVPLEKKYISQKQEKGKQKVDARANLKENLRN